MGFSATHIRFHVLVGTFLLLGFVSGGVLTAQSTADGVSEQLELGGRAGWSSLALRDQVAFEAGFRGGDDLILRDWGALPDAATDLLAVFDEGTRDTSGRYRSTSRGVAIVDSVHRFGTGSAAFNGDAVLTFEAGPDALLAPGTQPGQFTIDMWIHPLRISEGASILRWRGALINSGRPVLQELRLEVRDNRMVWTLNNLIVSAGPDGSRSFSSVELAARRSLIPSRWTHHQLRFDGRIGQISYRVDGVPEAISYLTGSGQEAASSGGVYFGADTGDGLLIGDGFHGFLDEFRITRDVVRTPRPVSFSGVPGRALTAPLSLGRSGARVDRIDVRQLTPGQTAVRTWYRVGDLVVSRDPEQALPTTWREVPADGRLPASERGRFIQLRFDLLADAAGSDTPRVQGVTVHYTPEPPPPPPAGLTGNGVAGGVELHWDPVLARDLAGYRVYVGERPGRYLGTVGVASPLDAGNRTHLRIDGLEPDRAYVFAVESYDRYGEVSGLTREIQVRAGRIAP